MPLSVFSVDLLSDNLLLLASVLVFFAILITKVGNKIGTPTLLLFLLLGMAAGADGIGLKFDNYEAAESIGHFAMTVILLAGGLETSLPHTWPVMKQGILLSSLGVLLATVLTGGFIYFVFGKTLGGIAATFLGCLLIAAIMSSTDSASVFSVLRGKRLHLREHMGPLLELESGSNDPMAYVLTIILVRILSTESILAGGPWRAVGVGILVLLLQLAVGFAVGIAVGYGAKWLLGKVNLSGSALYAILILSIGFFANGFASLLRGNGLLALYITGVLIGNKPNLPYRKDIYKFFDGLTWLMQLLMFLVLGLLARPSRMGGVILPALVIGLFIMFVSRPASVYLSLLPFRKMSFRAKTLLSWVGLKGAGPILFALCPVVAGLEGATDIFNIVFLITLLSLLLEGFTLSPAARRLGLVYPEDPEVETFGLEMPEEMGMMRDHLVTEDDLQRGSTLRDLQLPHGIRVVMVRRGERFLVPHGSMPLEEGDRLLIVMGDTDD